MFAVTGVALVFGLSTLGLFCRKKGIGTEGGLTTPQGQAGAEGDGLAVKRFFAVGECVVVPTTAKQAGGGEHWDFGIWVNSAFGAGRAFFRSFSFWSCWVVLYKLCSILLSYISSRSSTLLFAKSFSAIRPRVRAGSALDASGWGLPIFLRKLILLFGPMRSNLFFSSIASIVWFCICSARFSRHERLTIRSARIDSIGPCGASSARRALLWMSNSAWFSVIITSRRADRPCFRAFWETAALPSGVWGPVDFCAFRRFARIFASVDMI